MSREIRYIIDFKRQFIRVQYIEGGKILRTKVISEEADTHGTIEIRQRVSDDTKFPWECGNAPNGS